MSDSPKYNCGCKSGKSCFRSYDQAQSEIKRFRARRSAIKIEGRFLDVYRCKFCDCWHVGNTLRTLTGRRPRVNADDE